jgi:hypothetical protein
VNEGFRSDVVIRTPDERLRVFVSSTLGELADERRAASRAAADADQLLGGGVGDRGFSRDVATGLERERVRRLRDSHGTRVKEATLASDPDPATHMIASNVTGIANATRKIPTTASLQIQARNEGRKTFRK